MLFAEDSDIFKENQFTNAIASHTNQDGSDLNEYLDSLFEILNTPANERDQNVPKYLNDFPYVNGGLFSKSSFAPQFSRTTRKLIIESGSLDWAEINPDIFGSMFQAVNHADTRGSLGQHFTSVPNIMKVIEPLFLNDLYEEFEKANGNKVKLNKLLYRLKNIKIFDPACGSGNFLIIAYKELRRLEMKIFKELGSLALSEISLNQFYGIELDDFAHEVAILALWLTKHQMNVEFFREFGRTNPTLPLSEGGNVVQGNAARVNWEQVCSKDDQNEIYILGNPPYLGARLQSEAQKEDMSIVFPVLKGKNNLDYISIWFKKASNYIIDSNAQFSFVSTNSICQGEQVAILWPTILSSGLEINFAYQSFKWFNNAKGNAGVIVVIIGVANKSLRNKKLYNNALHISVPNINPYLVAGSNIYIQKRSQPLSKLPEINFGSMANDGGHLLLSPEEKDSLIKSDVRASKYIKRLYGALEFIRGIDKYCLWITEENKTSAQLIKEIASRVEATKISRRNSKRIATQKLASTPYQFGEVRYKETNSIIIPSVSSERRAYIPIGFLDSDAVIVAPNFAVYDAEVLHFALLTSRMQMVWMKAVGGRLKTDFRYSSSLVYNTFPIPPLSRLKKDELTQCGLNIISERFSHSEKTMAKLYDPDSMPQSLKESHNMNDLAVERCYKSTPFTSDEERLEYLFKLYERMIIEEKSANTLFAKQKKSRKRK